MKMSMYRCTYGDHSGVSKGNNKQIEMVLKLLAFLYSSDNHLRSTGQLVSYRISADGTVTIVVADWMSTHR